MHSGLGRATLLNEASHRQLMPAYLQAGQPTLALKQLSMLTMLRKELGVDPQPEDAPALQADPQRGNPTTSACGSKTTVANQRGSTTSRFRSVPSWA